MPGVLVSEALAQTSGLLLGLIWEKERETVDHKMRNFFLANVNIKFFNPAKPGETLRLEASLKKKYGKLFLFEVGGIYHKQTDCKRTLTLAKEN